MSETCKVVFYGELQQGFDPEQVLQAFSEKFGVSKEKARKLLEADKDVVLKGGLNKERARKYQAALEKIGLVVRIDGLEPEISPSGLALEPLETTDDESTMVMDPSQLAAALSKCPKCGSTHIVDGTCQDCGVIAAKYIAMKPRVKEENEEEEWRAKPENPYTAPEAELVEPVEGELGAPQGVPTGNAIAWLVKGWWHFKQNPIAWIMALVLLFLLLLLAAGVLMLTSIIPLLGIIILMLGIIAINLITPIISAGFLLGARAQDDGGDFTVGHLFAGFSNNPGQLILVHVIYLGAMILLAMVMIGIFIGLVGMQAMDAQNPEMMMSMQASLGFIVTNLLFTLLSIPLIMAYIFAPALVALDDLKAMEAMKLSFSGCWKNMLPFTVYGLLAVVMLIVGSIPFGLGLLIVLPVLTASIYAAYQDIYYN